MGFLLACFVLSAPATAWKMHGYSHGSATAMIDGHDHSAAADEIQSVPTTSAVLGDDGKNDTPPTPEKHQHLPSSCSSLPAILLVTGGYTAPCVGAGFAPGAASRPMSDFASPPPARPPRSN